MKMCIRDRFIAGVASECIPEQYVLLVFMTINLIAIFAIIVRKKSYIELIYNR